MDVRYINPFIQGLLDVVAMLGMTSIVRTGLGKKTYLQTENEVNIIIGLTGEVKGNIVFSMPEATAHNIASAMMAGVPVEKLDLISKSALCELANMIAGNSAAKLEGLGVEFNVTPPTLITGKNLLALISQVETLVINFAGNEGPLEMNVALEM